MVSRFLDEMASASSQSYEIAGTNPFLNELMANMGSDPTNAEAEQVKKIK